jgi:hypothetical protein
MRHVAGCASRQNQAERDDIAASAGVARVVQPQKREGEAAFHGFHGLTIGYGEGGNLRRAAPKKSANIIAGNGMLKIGRGGQGFDRFIGELFREKMAEEIAKCFAGEIADGALELDANKFEAVGLGTAKSFHGKREALFGVIGDGEDAAREIVIFRPEMQERLFGDAAHFPGKPGERGDAATIFANLNPACDGEFLETRLQFGGEVHAEEYKTNN